MHFVQAKSILTAGLGAKGINVYRGCTHGCIYCDSRSDCYRFTHAFEDIEVKQNAPELLETALRGMRERCMIGTGAMCDPYMPLEEKLGLTRRCLEIIERYGFGAAVQTKSDRVLRDIDLLDRINRKAKAVVQITLTTADERLCALVEPNVCGTARRAEALYALRDRGIPTVVWMTPILPYINDTEENVRALIEICVRAKVRGIITFGMGMTLRAGDREYYYAALDRHFPGLKERYAREYGNAYELESPNTPRLNAILQEACERYHILYGPDACFQYLNEFPKSYEQLSMF
ncbi:MAG: radical SAM protein [Clostridia bacterium]|nr:radical SAM protein [Clostridia bacterium]